MEWQSARSNDSVTWSAQTDASDWKSIVADFREFWIRLVAAIAEVHRTSAFDRVYFEVWIDSGRVIAYPIAGGQLRSSWRVAAQITSTLVLKEFDQLPDPDADSDAFESQATALEARVWQALRKASNDPTVRSVIKDLRASHPFTLWRQSANDEGTLEPFAIVA